VTILVATSVLRGGPEAGSHGAIHLVDLEKQRAAHVVDWKAAGVDWAAPGGGRGLRGIAFDGRRVFVAGADGLFEFNSAFELQAVYRSPYLSQCHDIAVFDRRLYLASTGYNSILGFDLDENRFGWGLHVAGTGSAWQGAPFDPQRSVGPSPGSELGLTSLWCDPRGLFMGGTGTIGLLYFDARSIERLVSLPRGVQNARPWRNGVLFNDTEAGVARFLTPESNRVFQVPHYPDAVLTGTGEGNEAAGRQGFVRGLCVFNESCFAVGSSPATLSVHNLDTMKTTLSITLSTDVRHSIHSLAVWPFEVPG
jgi:hypothetical protein